MGTQYPLDICENRAISKMQKKNRARARGESANRRNGVQLAFSLLPSHLEMGCWEGNVLTAIRTNPTITQKMRRMRRINATPNPNSGVNPNN